MKKILITLSIVAIAFCSAQAQSLSSWKQQKRFIENADRDSAGQIGKKGSLSFGGSLNKFHEDDSASGNISGGAWLELSCAAYKSANKNFGIDITIPIEFNNISCDGKGTLAGLGFDYDRVDIPVQFKPYYKYAFSKNFIVAPFVFASAGASFNSMELSAGNNKLKYSDCYFMYNFGAGMEILLYNDVAITPKFTYTAVSGMEDYPAVGNINGFKKGYEFAIEGAFRLVKGWTFLIEYAYEFNNVAFGSDDINGHIVRAGFRFGY